MDNQLLKASEVDSRLRYPSGRILRLARKGLIPHITLPDGEIRFDADAVDQWLRDHTKCAREPNLIAESEVQR